jgi:Na+/proline symporter
MNIILTSIGVFILLNAIVTWSVKKPATTKEGFFLADRKIPMLNMAFSVSATFLYAFGCIFASVFAYAKGWAGVTWLMIPNLIALTAVGIIGYHLLGDDKLKKGFNFTEVIKSKYENTTLTWFFTIVYLLATVYAITANLTGLGIVTEYIAPGMNYISILTVMSIVVLAYTLWGGLKTSIKTDAVQMILLLFVAIVGSIIVVTKVGGFGTVIDNWTTAKPAGLFDPSVLWIPGILLLALLTGSAVASNDLYQRVYALNDRSKVIKTFFLGGVFLIITMAGLGLMAGSLFSTELVPPKPHLAGTMALQEFGGIIFLTLFVVALMCAAASTIDSALNSAGSIISNDLVKSKDPVKTGRIAICIVMLGSFLLAWAKIDLWILLTTFGLLRLVIIAPTLYTIISKKVTKTDGWFILTGIATDIVFLVLSKSKTIAVSPVQEAYIGVLIPVIFIIGGKAYQKLKK